MAVTRLLAETGVIIPAGRQSPDPAQLFIESLKIQVSIDSGNATVHWDEVFHNNTGRILEGTYVLALPGGADMSDFAVWDDLTRIPGVILERKRASELYNQIRNQTIDPGLLESGELTDSSAPGAAQHATQFSVKIVPIPAYGYKRIEAEYRQRIPLSELAAEVSVPLKTSASNSETIKNLSIGVQLKSPQAITSFESANNAYPLNIASRTPNRITASFERSAMRLAENLVLRYRLAGDKLPQVQAFRDAQVSASGYFEASAILQPLTKQAAHDHRNLIVLFDSSLSMQWEKLERSFQALETMLRALIPDDSFNVLVFNSDVSAVSSKPEPATPQAIAKALDFVRASRLCGGTNLQKAFEAAFKQSAPNTYLVLLSDGGVTEGTISPTRFLEWFDRGWAALPKDRRPHIYTLAIGDDANVRFLQKVAAHAGVFERVGSTEPLEFKLNSFVRRIGRTPLDAATLNISPSAGSRLVYRLEDAKFAGDRASWVGEYSKPVEADFTVLSTSGQKENRQTTRARLPENDLQHPYLPAAWARQRVDALLEKIDRDGEDKATIDEIIELSRRYHFVTPYTSFLAAPRALLRPRLIRPGDPLLRVRTDPSIESVVALFPFGLIKPLRYLKAEDTWQTRFLAPADLPDGTHMVRLILRDKNHRVFREAKTFIISSHAPVVRIRLDTPRVHAGSQLGVHVQASETTRTIAVRFYGADPLFLHWNESDKSNTGSLGIPAGLPAGRYSLHVTVEDIAHNVSHQEVPLEVLP